MIQQLDAAGRLNTTSNWGCKCCLLRTRLMRNCHGLLLIVMKSAAFQVPHMQMWCLANHLAIFVIFLKGLVGWKHLIIMEVNPNHIQIWYPRSLNAPEKQILNQRNLTDRSHTGPELSTSFGSRFIGRLQGLLKEMIIWPAVWSWLILLATSICWLSWPTFAWQQGLL